MFTFSVGHKRRKRVLATRRADSGNRRNKGGNVFHLLCSRWQMQMIREHLEVSGTKAIFAVDVVAGEGQIPLPGQAALPSVPGQARSEARVPGSTPAPPCSDSLHLLALIAWRGVESRGSLSQRRGAAPGDPNTAAGASLGGTGHLPLTARGQGATRPWRGCPRSR